MIHASDKYSIYVKILIYIRYMSKISDIFENITIFSITAINSTRKVAVSFKIIMTMNVTRPCFTIQHQTCKTKTKTDFFGLRPVLS